MGIWSKIVDKDKNKKQFNNSLFDNDYNTPTLYGQITKEITPVNQVQSNNTFTPIANAVNNEVQGAGETNKTADDIMGLGQSAYNTYGNIKGGGGGGMGWIGIGQGAANGMGRYADSGDWHDTYEGFFGYDTEEDSDVMQAVKGTVNGAQMGGGVGGGWGALIGGVAGLASSFIDDF